VGGGPAGKGGGLLVRAHILQASQQVGHAARVAEGGMGGRVTGQQRGGLLVGARPAQAVQQAGHAVRVVEGGVGGRVTGQQRGGAPRLPGHNVGKQCREDYAVKLGAHSRLRCSPASPVGV
jgi:hypothetical protein